MSTFNRLYLALCVLLITMQPVVWVAWGLATATLAGLLFVSVLRPSPPSR